MQVHPNLDELGLIKQRDSIVARGHPQAKYIVRYDGIMYGKWRVFIVQPCTGPTVHVTTSSTMSASAQISMDVIGILSVWCEVGTESYHNTTKD